MLSLSIFHTLTHNNFVLATRAVETVEFEQKDTKPLITHNNDVEGNSLNDCGF